MGSEGNATPTQRRSGHFGKAALVGLLGLYGFLNLALFVASLIASIQTRKQNCTVFGEVDCGFARWVLYSILAPLALIAWTTSVIMMRHTVARTKGVPVDPLYMFRGIVFTLILLIPVVFVGWSNPDVVMDVPHQVSEVLGQLKSCLAGNCTTDQVETILSCNSTEGCLDLDKNIGLRIGGIKGTFNLDHLRNGPKSAYAACSLLHFNILFGALVAGIAAALAPPAGILAKAVGISAAE